MPPATISDEEGFESSLRNFLQWLDVLTMEPVELCNAWGNYNVAWELISDLNADGNAVLKAACSYLRDEQKHDVSKFLDSLNNIPKSLLVSATTTSANQDAMSDPCWMPYRQAARGLLQALASAAARNRAYFSIP